MQTCLTPATKYSLTIEGDRTCLEEDAFKGRTVLVTGGAGFFGQILCREFAKAGANVVINDLGGSYDGQGCSNEPAEALAKELKSQGYSVIADTHSILDAQQIIDATLREFGRIDVLVNNAAIIRYGAFQDMKPELIKQFMKVNVLGPTLLSHAVWPLFIRQGYGRIVNMASASILGMGGYVPYATSKASLVGLTKSLAAEVGKLDNVDIKVNAVTPTAYSRMMHELVKGQVEAFKNIYPAAGSVAIVLALALEACSISGEIFNAGGYMVNRIAFGALPGIRNAHSAEGILEQHDKLMGYGKILTQQSSLEGMVEWTMSDSKEV